MENEPLILLGRKAVLEALDNERSIDRILLRRDDRNKPLQGTLRVVAAKAQERRVVVQETTREKLDALTESGNHQGVVALCPAVEYVTVQDILNNAREKGEDPLIIVLDGVTDPHNLGAVIRTAEAGGAHGVIIPKRRAAGLTGTVVKASAGAVSYMPIARVTNITSTLETLKKEGLWIACAHMSGTNLFETDLTGPLALVLGAEGEGVSRRVSEAADFLVKIPMLGRIPSLNVSVAAGVIIYDVVRGREAKRS